MLFPTCKGIEPLEDMLISKSSLFIASLIRHFLLIFAINLATQQPWALFLYTALFKELPNIVSGKRERPLNNWDKLQNRNVTSTPASFFSSFLEKSSHGQSWQMKARDLKIRKIVFRASEPIEKSILQMTPFKLQPKFFLNVSFRSYS